MGNKQAGRLAKQETDYHVLRASLESERRMAVQRLGTATDELRRLPRNTPEDIRNSIAERIAMIQDEIATYQRKMAALDIVHTKARNALSHEGYKTQYEENMDTVSRGARLATSASDPTWVAKAVDDTMKANPGRARGEALHALLDGTEERIRDNPRVDLLLREQRRVLASPGSEIGDIEEGKTETPSEHFTERVRRLQRPVGSSDVVSEVDVVSIR